MEYCRNNITIYFIRPIFNTVIKICIKLNIKIIGSKQDQLIYS